MAQKGVFMFVQSGFYYSGPVIRMLSALKNIEISKYGDGGQFMSTAIYA